MSDDYRKYLGDAVYASFDGYQIWLEVSDSVPQHIALEPEVFAALIRYEQDLRAFLAQNKEMS